MTVLEMIKYVPLLKPLQIRILCNEPDKQWRNHLFQAHPEFHSPKEIHKTKLLFSRKLNIHSFTLPLFVYRCLNLFATFFSNFLFFRFLAKTFLN